MKNDALGDRMKQYENISRIYLTKRMPLIIRIDGKAFHTFTHGFTRPFDETLIRVMQKTTMELCKRIEGVKLGYVQSDEISLLLTDYENINTELWFGKNLQKIVSVVASMATLYFNRFWNDEVTSECSTKTPFIDFFYDIEAELCDKIHEAHLKASILGGMFDARAFILPKEEVCNYFIWRQNDCTRNSIQMVAQANFSHKQLQNKSCDELQEMLWQEKNINWNDFSTVEKRGSCCVKDGVKTIIDMQTGEEKERRTWRVDTEIPIFTQDRNYIERFV